MTKTRLALILFLLLAGSGCANLAAPKDFAHNETLALAWTVQTDGAINQTPLIVGETVILVPSGAPLLALDLETGAAKWTFAPPEGVWERAYVSDGKRVFVGVKGGSLAALDVSTGKLLWQTDLGINMQVPPLVSDGVLYAPTAFVGPELKTDIHGRAKLFALNVETGDELWSFESENYILQTPTRNGDTIYIGGNFYDPAPIDEGGHTRLYALDLADGSPRWKYESEDGFPKRLYATEQTLVFVGYQDFMNGVDAATGELRWRYDTGNWTPSFLGAGEAVYFSSANTLVFALDANSGEMLWQFNIPEGTFNYLLDAPVLLDGRLYFLTQQGDFFALDAASGELLWQAATEISAARMGPAIGNDWAVVGDIEGKVYGYR
ncbi:MAG: hypothetical protein AUJ21_04125 [Anaerolineae bacterium CG1_02_58_13]|nr:MAG: hypothetical protein AUJ21_04125 [Anaerolineae bacterium CG1_02_58_13]